MMDNSAGRGYQRLRAGICGRRARAMLAQPVRPVRPVRSVRSAPSALRHAGNQLPDQRRRSAAAPGVQRDADGGRAGRFGRDFRQARRAASLT
jgi:hypothetical protein